MDESCRTCTCTCMSDLLRRKTWLIYVRDTTHSHDWHDPFTCVTWLIHICEKYPLMCVTRLIHMRDMTHSHMWHDPLICVSRLIHMRDMTHSHMWHDPLICVTRLTHMRDVTHSHMWHDPLICVTYLRRQQHGCVQWSECLPSSTVLCVTWFIRVIWLNHMCAVEWMSAFICVHSYVCTAIICLPSYVCNHMCAIICVQSYVCSNECLPSSTVLSVTWFMWQYLFVRVT